MAEVELSTPIQQQMGEAIYKLIHRSPNRFVLLHVFLVLPHRLLTLLAAQQRLRPPKLLRRRNPAE